MLGILHWSFTAFFRDEAPGSACLPTTPQYSKTGSECIDTVDLCSGAINFVRRTCTTLFSTSKLHTPQVQKEHGGVHTPGLPPDSSTRSEALVVGLMLRCGIKGAFFLCVSLSALPQNGFVSSKMPSSFFSASWEEVGYRFFVLLALCSSPWSSSSLERECSPIAVSDHPLSYGFRNIWGVSSSFSFPTRCRYKTSIHKTSKSRDIPLAHYTEGDKSAADTLTKFA